MRLVPLEVAPLAPLIVPLSELVIFCVALALCLLVKEITDLVFRIVNYVFHVLPFGLGSKIANLAVTPVQQAVTNAIGVAVNYTTNRVGAAWHELARVVEWVGREIRNNASMAFVLASLIAGTLPAAALYELIKRLKGELKVVKGTVAHAAAAAGAVPAQVAHGIGEDVLPRTKALDRKIGVVIPGAIRAAEQAIGRTARQVRSLWKRIGRLERLVLGAAAAGVVGYALTHLGSTWIRCRNWNRLGREVCRTPFDDIDALLGLLAATAVTLEFRELVKLAQELEHGVAEGLQELAKL